LATVTALKQVATVIQKDVSRTQTPALNVISFQQSQ